MIAEYLDRGSLVARMEYYKEHTAEESGEHYAYSVALREIRNAPAADVAPVVQCKDCKHHYDCGVHFCDRLGMNFPDDSDFFCSYGERKDGGVE
jgi:hypothetical protein